MEVEVEIPEGVELPDPENSIKNENVVDVEQTNEVDNG